MRIRSAEDLRTLAALVQRLNGDTPTTVSGHKASWSDVEDALTSPEAERTSVSISSDPGAFGAYIGTADGVERGRKFVMMHGRDPHGVEAGSSFKAFEAGVKARVVPFSRWQVLFLQRNVLNTLSSGEIDADRRKRIDRWKTAGIGLLGAIVGAGVKTLIG